VLAPASVVKAPSWIRRFLWRRRCRCGRLRWRAARAGNGGGDWLWAGAGVGRLGARLRVWEVAPALCRTTGVCAVARGRGDAASPGDARP